MRNPRLIIIWIAYLCAGIFTPVNAQMDSVTEAERFIEMLVEESEEGVDLTQWLEELVDLYENPLDINLASLEELLRIPFLNETLANNILAYRQKAGSFKSKTELTSVEGINREIAGKTAYFIVVGSEADKIIPSSGSRNYFRHQFLIKGWQTLPRSAGYLPKGDKPPAYAGSSQKIYTRYLVQSGQHFQAGITGDKDPGETFFRGINKQGFDFYSAHLSFRVNGFIPRVIFGDFAVRAGQGLVLWQGFSMGKTAEVLQISRPGSQLVPYTSSDENFFFRGGGASFQLNKVRTFVFVSSKKSDGNLESDKEGNSYFTSLQTSGYHRTSSEIEDKNSIGHGVIGLINGITLGKLYLGCNILAERFRFPYLRGDQLYQKFLFRGEENLNVSVDYRYIPGRYQFFGELARSASGGVAMIHGFQGRLHDQVHVAMIYRQYDKNYHATWGSAFGENSRNANETGFYAGIKAYPGAGLTFSGYADWYRFGWLNYLTAGPTSGHEYLLQIDWKHARKITGTLRWKAKVKTARLKSGNLYEDYVNRRQGFRLNFRYQLNDHWFVRSRYERSAFAVFDKEQGQLVYQDIGWAPSSFPVTLTARFSWFSTDGYDSRIYAYENDLLYNFSTVALFGEGIRGYLNLRIRMTEGLYGWLKVGRTHFFGQDEISSGNSRIDGNAKSEVKIQMRYRF
jgi:hypothetical protein